MDHCVVHIYAFIHMAPHGRHAVYDPTNARAMVPLLNPLLTLSLHCFLADWNTSSVAACMKQLWCAGGHRTCNCAALGQGAQLVQVSRQLFMSFVLARPRTLQIYLHKVALRLSHCTGTCVCRASACPAETHTELF